MCLKAVAVLQNIGTQPESNTAQELTHMTLSIYLNWQDVAPQQSKADDWHSINLNDSTQTSQATSTA